MKKIQAIILAVSWVGLLTSAGRVLIHMTESVKTFEQGLTMFAFIMLIGVLMYGSYVLIYQLLKESFGRQ